MDPDLVLPSGPDRGNDTSLVARIREGDDAAFQALYIQYYPSLTDFVFRYVRDGQVAEEIVHDIFLALWVGRASWSPSHGVAAYLFGAARNRALNVGRSAGVAGRFAATVSEALTPQPLPTDAAVLAGERAAAVRAAVANLPERAREAVILRWMHGMSHAGVASVLHISEEAARKLVARAAIQLRTLLHDHAPESE